MSYAIRRKIVAEAWMILRKAGDKWQDVITYGDIGFPLAYAEEEGWAEAHGQGRDYIEELYAVILDQLGIEDSIEYTSFEDLLDANIAAYADDEDDSKPDFDPSNN